MRLKSDLYLLLAAFIWGTTFVVQRAVANDVGVFLFNGIRFLIGALALIPFARRSFRIRRKDLLWVGLAGFVLFAGSALQQAGLRYTTAANAGFITGLYVVLVPLLMAFIFKKHVRPISWAAALISVAGVWMLSGGGKLGLNLGDGLELVGAFMWALQILLVGKISRRMDILSFAIGQFVVAGVLQLILGGSLEFSTIGSLKNAWWAILYSGIMSVAIGFTLQAYGQKHSPPADSSIILSTEAVFATIFGYLFLSEGLTFIQVVGCALILAAMLLSQVRGGEEKEKPQETPRPVLKVVQEI